MKTTLYSILAAAACGMAFGQTAYTNPVGYTSQTLAPSSSNIIGINVLKPTLVSGLVTVVSGANITASAINFTTALPTGKSCVLEITSGTAAGTVQDFITWSGSTITLPAAVTGLAIGDKISVRAANTLQELFPAGTLVVSGNLNASAADKIWIPQYDISGMFTGTYIRYFMKGGLSNPGWHTTPNGSTIGETLALSVDINLTPGTYIQRVGASDVEIKFNVPSSYPSF